MGLSPSAMSKETQGLEGGWCPLSLWGQGGTPVPPAAPKRTGGRPFGPASPAAPGSVICTDDLSSPVTWSPSSMSSQSPHSPGWLYLWSLALLNCLCVPMGWRAWGTGTGMGGGSATPPGRPCPLRRGTMQDEKKSLPLGATRSRSETPCPSPRPCVSSPTTQGLGFFKERRRHVQA